MNPLDEEKEKPKQIKDLTLGAFHPTERIVETGKGVKVRLEDYTTPRSKEDIDNEHAGEHPEEALRT